jgi:hypothetical protein
MAAIGATRISPAVMSRLDGSADCACPMSMYRPVPRQQISRMTGNAIACHHAAHDVVGRHFN